MPSAIIPTVPVGPVGHAPDMRANFAAAKDEIETLQVETAALETAVAGARIGVTDGSDAKPGEIGEFLFAARATSSAIVLVSGVVRDVLALTLQPGDWDVQGAMNTSGSSGNVNDVVVWVSPQSATRPSTDLAASFAVVEINFGTGGQSGVDTRTGLTTGVARASISQPTTIYLSTSITFGGGTCLASGALRARRMR